MHTKMQQQQQLFITGDQGATTYVYYVLNGDGK